MEESVSDRLIVRYLTQEASAEEREQVEQWLKNNPQNQKIMREWEMAWKAGYDPKVSFDEKRGMELLQAKLESSTVPDSETRHTPPTFNWLRVAAALAILSAAAFLIYRYQDGIALSPEELMVEKVNPKGMKSTFSLSDGSLVKLNAGSQLRFPKKFSAVGRTVYLTGEAYFEVARDEDRPFKVISENLTTEVLGTSFAVKAFPEALEAQVIVASGKVQVSSKAANISPVVLRPREKVVYHKQGGTMTKSQAENEQELAWKDDILLFDETPLREVTHILEQWYGVEVKLANQGLEHCTLTGRFEDESLSHVLEAIRYSIDIEIERTENQINMTGKGCKP